MKTLLAAGLAFGLIACAGGNATSVSPPELTFVQLSGPADQNYTGGRIEVQYGLRIANRSGETITLRQIQIQPVGAGGPYRVVPKSYYFERAVPAQQFEDVTFWADAVAGGDPMADDARAPVTIRATAFFESPAGNFRRVFTQMLDQTGSGSTPR